MNDPLLSLIVPVYNVENYIIDCAESIAQQQSFSCQVLFVDDGSTDGSVRMLESYIARHSLSDTWSVIKKVNGGLSSARNFGLKYATGRYVWFIDSDDMLAEKSLSSVISLLLAHTSLDLLLFNYDRFTNLPENTDSSSSENSFYYLSKEQVLTDIFQRKRDNYSWAFVSKKSTYLDNAIQFPEGKTFEDMATTYKVVYFSEKIGVTDALCYHYRVRSGSISNTVSQKSADDILENLREIKNFFSLNPSKVYNDAFASFAAYFALLAYQQHYSRKNLTKVKEVFGELDAKQINFKYRVAYILARTGLLEMIQSIRKYAQSARSR